MKCYRQELPEIDRQMLPVAEVAGSALLVGYRNSCRYEQCLPVTSPGFRCQHLVRHDVCNSIASDRPVA